MLLSSIKVFPRKDTLVKGIGTPYPMKQQASEQGRSPSATSMQVRKREVVRICLELGKRSWGKQHLCV